MTLKIGGLYRTRHKQDLVRIEEVTDHNFLNYIYRGRFSISSQSHISHWAKDGRYTRSMHHDYDLIEEVTDPVLLAFYET